jgi:hypothetical protein
MLLGHRVGLCLSMPVGSTPLYDSWLYAALTLMPVVSTRRGMLLGHRAGVCSRSRCDRYFCWICSGLRDFVCGGGGEGAGGGGGLREREKERQRDRETERQREGGGRLGSGGGGGEGQRGGGGKRERESEREGLVH